MPRKFKFNIKKAALLVIDLQDYFTDPRSHAYIAVSKVLIPKINKLIQKFHRAKRPVIFTRHIDVDPANVMSRWWNDNINEANPLSRLNKKLLTKLGRIIVKHQYDAFYKTGLEKILKAEGTEQVVITGVVSHLCCETTARSAFMRDFEVFFAEDATASYFKKHHNATIYNLSHGFAEIMKCSQL